ncbi:hypothetical protein ROS62_30385 [Streptomyces sp. DSM 41972]|uniref:Uncharacterized protein n=1 Tax=Streptomyces althioticus subsp. attaecolombicae TaxID=3075534 RepID=A0ABU3I7K1_9ACTN|nr:hypothetical protein [Streptomyces sp. DSM 41972]SCD89177.1 hypothetical protein GA0115238_13142 [Streptomyces sp. di50b]SCE55674.1 hypothetical protein GA0115245_15202 [Streptomyces sp. di188]
MIEIETYLRDSGGEFVQVDACAARPADADYVEGAVRIAIHGVEIIGISEWDYVDQLWAYMASMVPQLSTAGYASTYFPDQPIELSFRRQGSQVLVSAKSSNGTKKASVSTSDFVAALRGAGKVFFGKMSELLPENADSYSESRRELLS